MSALSDSADMPMRYLEMLGLTADQALLIAWALLIGSLLAIAVVSVKLVGALFARSRPASGKEPTPAERPASIPGWVPVGLGAVAFVLFLSAVWAVGTLASIGKPSKEPAFTIEVTGHEWWWQVRYLSDEPQRNLTTANEIHIPVGEIVRVRLSSPDVIHSFWVPSLGGKTDLIPGQINVTWIQADRPGVYRGQCAEFCGLQHANMAFLVVASEPETFEAWWDKQLEGPPPPSSEAMQQGKNDFIKKCGACHSVRGTRANGIVGPDLSHLAQRRTIAAGTLPNTTGYLAGWIADPQHVKPGNLMPRPDVSSTELQRIVSYLRTLE